MIALLFSFSVAEDLPLGSSIPMANIKMKDINGKQVSLNSVKMENGLLVNFTCNTCPWVIKWQDRYNELAKASQKNKIGFIALNPNAGKRDRGEDMRDMKKFAKKYGHDFLYALDEGAKLASAFGAKYTPHIYLFDGNGMRIDGVSQNKTASKYGILKGDIVVGMADFDITDMTSYMQALSNYNKGDSTTVKLNRDGKIISVAIIFQ